MYASRGRGGGSSLPFIYIAYFMQKGRKGVQIACKNANVLHGRPPGTKFHDFKDKGNYCIFAVTFPKSLSLIKFSHISLIGTGKSSS